MIEPARRPERSGGHRAETRIENSGDILGVAMRNETTVRLDFGPDPIPELVRAITLTVTL